MPAGIGYGITPEELEAARQAAQGPSVVVPVPPQAPGDPLLARARQADALLAAQGPAVGDPFQPLPGVRQLPAPTGPAVGDQAPLPGVADDTVGGLTAGAASAQDRFNLAQGLLEQRVRHRVADPTGLHRQFGEMESQTGRARESGRMATRARLDAEVQGAEEHARILDDEAAAQRADLHRMSVQEALRREQASLALERARDQAAHAAAVERKFQESAEVDPDRYWASKTGGQKFLLALSAGLLGFSGRDPFQMIQSAIDDDIDAQKANIAKRRQGVDAAMSSAQAQQNLYAQVIQSLGTEREADLTWRLARIDEAKARVQAMQAKYGAQAQGFAANELMSQLDQESARLKFELQREATQYPAEVTRSGYMYTGREAEGLRLQRDQALKDVGEGRGAVRDVLTERDKQAIASMGKQQLGGLTPESFSTGLRELARNTAAHTDLSRKISEFNQRYPGDSDIPGVKRSKLQRRDPDELNPFNQEPDKVKSFLERIFNDYRVAVTGAGASIEEVDRLRKSLFGAETEEQVRAALSEMQQSADTYLSTYRRGTHDAVIEYFDRDRVKGTESKDDLGFQPDRR